MALEITFSLSLGQPCLFSSSEGVVAGGGHIDWMRTGYEQGQEAESGSDWILSSHNPNQHKLWL